MTPTPISLGRKREPGARAAAALLGIGAAGTAALATLWAAAVEPRLLDVQRLEVELPHLGPSWSGQSLALLADLQIGIRFGNTDTVGRAVERALGEDPALVLLAGDFVYDAVRHPDPALRTLRRALQPLEQVTGRVFAVLGNHDYGEEGSRLVRLELAGHVRRTLEDVGIRVLENEAVRVTSAAGEPLHVVGIGPHIPAKDEPPAAVAGVPEREPRIVFMHNPVSFADLPAHAAPLAFAGHTHGGQLRVPFRPTWTLGRFTVPWPEYLDGWLDGYGQPGNRLYVNRGIGFSRRPIRFACPPELTLITLACPR